MEQNEHKNRKRKCKQKHTSSERDDSDVSSSNSVDAPYADKRPKDHHGQKGTDGKKSHSPKKKRHPNSTSSKKHSMRCYKECQDSAGKTSSHSKVKSSRHERDEHEDREKRKKWKTKARQSCE